MRHLVIVPIIHGEEDSGSLRGAIAQKFRSRLGARGWQAHQRTIASFWQRVAALVDQRALDAPRLHVYQDGLPVCGRERAIVDELAARGSANHQIVRALLERGATLVGTEDPALLLREYEHIQKQLATSPRASRSRRAGKPSPAAAEAQAITASLAARDTFIARCIADTLPPDHTGILFLGVLHDLEARLAALSTDIAVEYLIERAEVVALAAV